MSNYFSSAPGTNQDAPRSCGDLPQQSAVRSECFSHDAQGEVEVLRVHQGAADDCSSHGCYQPTAAAAEVEVEAQGIEGRRELSFSAAVELKC